MLPLPALSTLQRTALLILLGVLLLSAVAQGGYLYGTGKAAEKAAERERDARTVADIRAGNQRLRLQVTACSATPTDSPGGPAALQDWARSAVTLCGSQGAE